MKLRMTLVLIILVFIAFILIPSIVMANPSGDDDLKSATVIASAERGTDPLGRKSAGEISLEKSEKEKQKKAYKKRIDRKTRAIERMEDEFINLTPIEKKLARELPYEVRVRLRDIPSRDRLDWLIDRLIERKAPMIRKKLMENERFRNQWENTPAEDRPSLLKRGMKSLIGKERGYNPEPETIGKRQISGAPEKAMHRKRFDSEGKINPEQRKSIARKRMGDESQKEMRKYHSPGNIPPRFENRIERDSLNKFFRPEELEELKNLPPDKIPDFIYRRMMDRKGENIKEFLNDNPQLRKRLENLPLEKRKEAIKRVIKREITSSIKRMRHQGMMKRKSSDGKGQQRIKKDKNPPMMKKFRGERPVPDGMKPNFKKNPAHKGKNLQPDRIHRERKMDLKKEPLKSMKMPLERKKQMMHLQKQGNMENPQFMNPEMHKKMIKHFMDNPDMLRQIIGNLPPEFKKMLFEMLAEDLKVERKMEKEKEVVIKKPVKDKKLKASKKKSSKKKKE